MLSFKPAPDRLILNDYENVHILSQNFSAVQGRAPLRLRSRIRVLGRTNVFH